MWLLLAALAWVWVCTFTPSLVAGTERPIIGVLAQETCPEYCTKSHAAKKTSYIAARYVKAVEAAGARVAPVFINQTKEYYEKIMSSLNGLMLPGGDADLTAPDGYGAAGRVMLDIAMKLQDSGISFPILGVCQGYEMLTFLTSGANKVMDVLIPCQGNNMALPLNFSSDFRKSRLYKSVSKEIVDILKNLPVTANYHHKCVTKKKLKAFGLNKTWRVMTTSKDANGLEFVSSSEHFNRPIVGLQFHPERVYYEWNPDMNDPHSREAILSNRPFYDWLVNESRGNNQSFPSLEEDDALIYNFSPKYTGRHHAFDELVYFF